MYTDFFKLKDKPFNIVPNPDCLYPSSRHRLALTYLEYGLSQSIGFILLTGEIGIGNTTLIRKLLSNLDSSVETALLSNTNLSADDLLKQVMREFDLEPEPSDKPANLDIFNSFLIDRYSRGINSLLIIDEAQNLSLPALEEVRMLSNLQTSEDNLLQIMLVGQPELRARIRDPRLAQLAQRIAVSYHLSPLERSDTRDYILYRLKMAGREDDGLFTPEATDLIHEKSKGVPRSINILCDMALVYAFGDEVQVVDRSLVEQVITDREQEGVVPNGAVWVESGESLGASEIPQGETAGRLTHLEKSTAELRVMIQQQGRELQDRLAEDKDRLISTLQELLEQERARSDKYYLKYFNCIKKMRSLEQTLSDKNGPTPTNSPDSKDTDHEDDPALQLIKKPDPAQEPLHTSEHPHDPAPRRPGLLRRLFSTRNSK